MEEKQGFAVYSNDRELSEKVIEKLVAEGWVQPGKMTSGMLTCMVYIAGLDIMVSHLCLEMHYSQYESAMMYGTEYLTLDKTKTNGDNIPALGSHPGKGVSTRLFGASFLRRMRLW